MAGSPTSEGTAPAVDASFPHGRALAATLRMMIALGILFLVGWLMLKLVWGVASFGVHLLLVAAVVAMIFHFVRGRGGAATP